MHYTPVILLFVSIVAPVLVTGCFKAGDDPDFSDAETGDGDGDGDGDPTTGDGDGDPTTGDGDGETNGDGDGDDDPTMGDLPGDGDGDVIICHPLLQDCPAADTGCYWVGSVFNCVMTVGDIPSGSPCGYINDCSAGLICTATESLPACNDFACCTPFCDLVDPYCNQYPNTECTAFFEEGMAPPGYEDVGVCILPNA